MDLPQTSVPRIPAVTFFTLIWTSRRAFLFRASVVKRNAPRSTDIAAVKYTMAKVLREVSYNALHILGSLGTTNLTPIQAMYAAAPTMGIADGVDEVHKATVARNVLKSYRPHEGYWPTEYIPAKREQAWRKFQPKFDADPNLLALAEGYKKYFTDRH